MDNQEQSVTIVLPSRTQVLNVLTAHLSAESAGRIMTALKKNFGSQMTAISLLRVFVTEVNEHFSKEKDEMFGKTVPEILIALQLKDALVVYKEGFESYMKKYEEQPV